MKKIITEFDFYSAKMKTRCGHIAKLTSWSTTVITGYVIVMLPNGKEFHHTMEWDRYGESINKHIRPTEHYYDIKVADQ